MALLAVRSSPRGGRRAPEAAGAAIERLGLGRGPRILAAAWGLGPGVPSVAGW
jgi:hypothetical protein